MKLTTLFYILLLLLAARGASQTTIRGKVTDVNNGILQNASIILSPEGSAVITAYGYTDDNGKFSIVVDKTGNFDLVISALSFKPVTIAVKISTEAVEINKDVVLQYEPLELNEVIINTTSPISVKQDTIVFDAKYFSQGNEQVVEDLLKKIPGLSISDDGTIKVGNQEIENIMIDGDDMFDKGYKLLTKNMPVNPIDKIEVLQHYSNNKHLKGIEKSERVALNLTLKDDFKRQWFGNTSLGYGVASDNRYEAKGNLMNFGKKDKYYFLTNLNNIGIDATGDIDHLIRPYRGNEPGGVGDDQNAQSILSINAYQPQLKQKRVNLNNAEMVSLNAIHALSSKIKLKTLGFFNSDGVNFYKNSIDSYFVEGTNFTNTQNQNVRKNTLTGFGKADLIYDINANVTLEYTAKFNSTKGKNTSALLFNENYLEEHLNALNQLIDHKIICTNKFKKNSVLLISGRYINEKTPQNYGVNQFIYQDLLNTEASNVKQYSQNKMQFAGLEGHLIDRKSSGDLLELQFGNKYRNDKLDSDFVLFNENVEVSRPPDFQNNVGYIVNDTYAKVKYLTKFKRLSIFGQLELHQFFNELKQEASLEKQSPFLISPKIGADWEINKTNIIQTSYSYTPSNATILDVYSNYIHTGFRDFSKGTGNFNILEASSFLLNYNYGSWGDKFFANTFFLYTKNHDFFSTNTLIAQNYSLSKKIIIKDREFITFSSNVNRYFKFISSNLKLLAGGSKYNFKNIVNDSDLREVRSLSVNYGFELRSGFRGFFNYHIGSKWDHSEVSTTITNSYTNNTSFLDLSFMFSPKFNIQLQSERYYFGNIDSNSNKYYFLDAEARYTVKDNKLTFTLSGQNLFNTKTFTEYLINDVNISVTEYRLMPRYLLLKAEYRF